MKFVVGFFLLFLIPFVSFSQVKDSERYTEEQIAEESQFVNAAQKQLLGKFDEAIEDYLKIIKADKSNPVVFFQLSRCYEATEDYNNSIKYGLRARDLDPKNEFYLMQLAEAYAANKEFSKAAEQYFNYTKNMPKESFFYEKAVYNYMQGKDYDNALTVLDKMEDNLGKDEIVTHQKFEIYSKLGDSKKATKELESLAKEFPKESRYSLNLANYYLQLGEIDKARNVFKRILKVDPNNETAKKFMSVSDASDTSNEISYLRAVSVDIPNKSVSLDDKIAKLMPAVNRIIDSPNDDIESELVSISEQLVEAYPESAKAFALHGDILQYSDNKKEAIEAYNKTLQIDGSVFEVWYQKMNLEKEMELFSELLKTSDNALLRFPNQGIAYLFHGYALNQTGETSDAFDILQEAMLFVGQNDALRKNLKAEMARSRYLEESYALALKILNSEKNNSAEALELYGDIYFKQGDESKALDAWKKALELEPQNKRLSKKVKNKQL